MHQPDNNPYLTEFLAAGLWLCLDFKISLKNMVILLQLNLEGSFFPKCGLVHSQISRPKYRSTYAGLKTKSAEVFHSHLKAVPAVGLGNGAYWAGLPKNSSAHSCIISHHLPITMCVVCESNVCVTGDSCVNKLVQCVCGGRENSLYVYV